MKRKKWLAGLMTLVVVVTMTLNLAPTSLANGGDGPSIGFGEHRDWYYTDEALNIALDKSGLEEVDYDSIEWRFGYWNEEKQDGDMFNYKYSSDDGLQLSASEVASLRSMVVEASGGSDILSVSVSAVKDGEEIASCGIGIQLREPYYEYRYPGGTEEGIEIVAGWDYRIDGSFGVYAENGTHPNGQDLSAEITGITSDNDAVKVTKEEGCYLLTAGSQAWGKSAKLVITYKDPVTGKEAQYTTTVNVVDTVTNLNVWSSKTTNQVLPGETVELYANAVQEWDGGSISFPGELEEEAILEWSTEQEGVTIKVNEEPSSQCEVTVSEELLGQDAVVTATLYQKNSDGKKGDKLASESYSLYVTDEYYEIVLKYSSDDKNFDTLYPGESCEVTPVLLYYQRGKEAKEIEAVWGWDISDAKVLAVSKVPQDGKYVIARNSSSGADLNLSAVVEEEVVAEAGWQFDDVYGEVWFEDYEQWMYTDKEDSYTVQLNTEQLEGMTYTVTYQLVTWNEEGEEVLLEGDDLKGCLSEDENHLISLNATGIYDKLKAYASDGCVPVSLRAVAEYSDNSSENEIYFEVYEPHVDYYPQSGEGWTTLKGVEDYLWVAVEGWNYCAESPYGEYFSCELLDCKIAKDEILTAKKTEEDGIEYYKLIGKEIGETAVTITYKDYKGNTQTMEATVYVSDEDYYAVINGENALIRPGSSTTLNAELYRCYLNDDGEPILEKLTEEDMADRNIKCYWEMDNEERFSLEESSDTYSCTVKASADAEYDSANIYCWFGNKEKDDYYATSENYYIESHSDPYYDWTIADDHWIDTFSGYYYLGYDKDVTFEVKDLTSHYVEDGTEKDLTLQGITYDVSMGENAEEALNIVKKENGKYTVSRIGDGDAVIYIQAYRNKTLIAEYEVTFYDYSVYTDTDQTLSLCPGQSGTVNLSIHKGDYDADNKSYEETESWSVSEFEWLNEESIKSLLGSDVTVTQSEDTMSFTVSIAEGSTAKGNITVELAAHLMDGTVLKQTVYLGTFGVHDYESEIIKEATATEEGQIKYTCKNCGSSYTETIAKTGTDGKDNTDNTDSTTPDGTQKKDKDTSVKTGDNNSIILWIAVAAVALAACAVVIARRKRTK